MKNLSQENAPIYEALERFRRCLLYTSSGSDPADFADNSILAGGIFLFCKRIGKISQVVYGDEALQKSSGQLCKGACHDIKDKAVYSASGIRNADVCIFYDEQSAGAYFYSSADPF